MSQLNGTLVLICAGSALLLAGCSGAPAATTPASQPAISSSATPVPTAPSPSPSASSTACPEGEFIVTSFSATGKNGALGNGKGGDMGVEFKNGRYEIDFDDEDPISLTLPSGTGQLILDGSVEGTYTGTGSSMKFTLGKVDGTAKTRYQGNTKTVPIKQVAAVIGLSGSGSATCTGDNLSLKVGTTTFEMVRES